MNAWQRALRAGRHDWALSVGSILSVAIAFVCLASALLVVANVQELRVRWSHTGRASVYLQPSAEQADIDAIMAALRSTRAVTHVEHVTSELARKELLQSGDEVLAGLPPRGVSRIDRDPGA